MVEKEVKSVTERVFLMCLFVPFSSVECSISIHLLLLRPLSPLSLSVCDKGDDFHRGVPRQFPPLRLHLIQRQFNQSRATTMSPFSTLLTTYFHHYTTTRLLLDAETTSTTTRLISCDPEKRNRATLREWHCVARPCTTHTHTQQQHLAIRKKWINFLFVVSCKQGSKKKKKEKTKIVIHHAKSIKGKRYLCVRAPVTREWCTVMSVKNNIHLLLFFPHFFCKFLFRFTAHPTKVHWTLIRHYISFPE